MVSYSLLSFAALLLASTSTALPPYPWKRTNVATGVFPSGSGVPGNSPTATVLSVAIKSRRGVFNGTRTLGNHVHSGFPTAFPPEVPASAISAIRAGETIPSIPASISSLIAEGVHPNPTARNETVAPNRKRQVSTALPITTSPSPVLVTSLLISPTASP